MQRQSETVNLPYLNKQDREDNGARYKPLEENRHHLVPRSRVDPWSDNVVIKLFTNLHDNYHWLFGNAVFQEALAQMLKINWPVLSDKYRKDLEEVINMSDDYVYRNWIYLKR